MFDLYVNAIYVHFLGGMDRIVLSKKKKLEI